MTILAIETSTPCGSVALLRGKDFLFEETFTADRSHSASLFGALEGALKFASPIDQVAVGLGPGSYAGVRIAIAAGIGLQLGMRAALVGVPSVAALDAGTTEYVAIGDARRDAFYFTHVINGICVAGPRLHTEAELRALLALLPRMPVFTSGPLPTFPDARVAQPTAACVSRIASGKTGITARESLEPVYLREPHITTATPA